MPVGRLLEHVRPAEQAFLLECRRLKVLNYVSKPVTFSSFSKAVADVFHLPSLEGGPGSDANPAT